MVSGELAQTGAACRQIGRDIWAERERERGREKYGGAQQDTTMQMFAVSTEKILHETPFNLC